MPDSPQPEPTTKRLWLAALAVVLGFALWLVRDAVLLGFAAVLIAVATHGIADPLTARTRLPRAAALGLAACMLIGVLTGILWLFGMQIATEFAGVIERLPKAWERVRTTLSGDPLGASFVADIESTLAGKGDASLPEMIARAGSYTLPVASGLTTALLVFFIAAFLTVGASSYRSGALLLMPKGFDEKVGAALDDSAHALKKWLLGILLDMVLITIALGVTLWALGVPAFIGLALIAGIAQFVPTVGPLVASIPAILLAFTVSPATALWTAFAYLVISQIEANVVYPIIQKQAVSVPPALNLLAVLAFGILLGPLGVLLATPMLVVLSVFVVRLYVRDTLSKEAKVPGT